MPNKNIIHVYFGDHKNHPIILNYINEPNRILDIIDASKKIGSRYERLNKILYSLFRLPRRKNYIFHTHDLLSFYVVRLLFPFKRVVFDSHEVYSSYFRFPFNIFIKGLEELSALIAYRKIYPSCERQDLYFFRCNAVVIQNLFSVNSSLVEQPVLDRDLNAFVYAGLISEQRCICELIDMFRDLPSIKLTIYGAENAYIKKLIKKGLPTNVKYAGVVPHNVLVKRLPKYAASFALYHPCDLNNKYPAPTKIFENEFSGIATIVLKSKYLDRLVQKGVLKNTFVMDSVKTFFLKSIIESGGLETCIPNTSPQILWESQKELIDTLYS